MSRLPPIPNPDPRAALGALQRRVEALERVLQQIEGAVSPFDGSAQAGMFASGTIGGSDVGAGQLTGSHILTLGVTGILNSSGTTLQGNTALGSGAAMVLASGVSQPITSPGVSLTAGGSLSPSTAYWVSFSWYDGTHETTIYTPAVKITTTASALSLALTLPIAPVGATQANVYMDTASFGIGGGKLQAAIAVSTTAPTATTITSFNAAGAASPATSSTGFTSAAATINPASAVDSTGAAYGWSLEGNGRVRITGPTLNTQFWLYDDFYYVAAAYGAATGAFFGSFTTVLTGTAAAVTAGVSGTANPGVMQLATGTTATGAGSVRTNNSFAVGTARIRFSVYFMVDTAPNATNSYFAAMGLTNSSTPKGLAAADIGIQIQNATDSTAQIMLAVANGSALSTVTSTALFSAAGWHFVEFEVNAGLTAVNWWIDTTKQTPITTNIPTSATTLFLGLGIKKTATGAGLLSRTLNIDTVGVYGDYVSG